MFFNFDNTNKISWLQVLLFSFIPLGQLIVRIFYLNGSLDKLWLMFPILLMPPFSLIPLLLIKFGFVQDGKGSDPIDKIMLLPLIARIVTLIVLHRIGINSPSVFILINLLINLFTIIIANLTRRYYNCEREGVTMDSVGKAVMDSTIAYAISEITPVILSFLPFIGVAYSILGLIIGLFTTNEYILDAVFSNIGFAVSYILINMFNQDNIGQFCSTPFTGNIVDKIAFFISIVIIVLVKTGGYMGIIISGSDE
jgi:hypothetical protein